MAAALRASRGPRQPYAPHSRSTAFTAAPIRQLPAPVQTQPGAAAPAAARAGVPRAAAHAGGVEVELSATSFSSRKLDAAVHIGAPLELVWGALTDYEHLGTFIPSLVENRCLERRPTGCILYQVGAQDVAMGVKFSAACTLEIQEHPDGIPGEMCSPDHGTWDDFFPSPACNPGGGSGSASSSGDGSGGDVPPGTRDISFALVDGDFQAFKGLWRLQPGESGALSSTLLSYCLFVKPHAWLPVGLIQSRISSEVVNNLQAVRRHTERLHRHMQQRQPQQRQATAEPAGAAAGSSGEWEEAGGESAVVGGSSSGSSQAEY